MLGLIATRSTDTVLPGIAELIEHGEQRIRNGLVAYEMLQRLRANSADEVARQVFMERRADLGYALLLKRHVENPLKATDADIRHAAENTVPPVGYLFWVFRIMVACGFFFIALFAFAFYLSSIQQFERYRWFLRIAVCALPLPWLAAELGWTVAEIGRQPWVIEGVLPTHVAVSVLSSGQVWTSLGAFLLFYSLLAIVDVFLMARYIRMGPELALGRRENPPDARVAG